MVFLIILPFLVLPFQALPLGRAPVSVTIQIKNDPDAVDICTIVHCSCKEGYINHTGICIPETTKADFLETKERSTATLPTTTSKVRESLEDILSNKRVNHPNIEVPQNDANSAVLLFSWSCFFLPVILLI